MKKTATGDKTKRRRKKLQTPAKKSRGSNESPVYIKNTSKGETLVYNAKKMKAGKPYLTTWYGKNIALIKESASVGMYEMEGVTAKVSLELELSVNQSADFVKTASDVCFVVKNATIKRLKKDIELAVSTHLKSAQTSNSPYECLNVKVKQIDIEK